MQPAIEYEGDATIIRVPMSLKRRSGRKEIIVPEVMPGVAPRNTEPQKPMVTALARALLWQELIESGE